MLTTLSLRLLLLAMLAGCGQKADGTSYGVNPAKHPDGHLLTDQDSVRPDHETHRGMPKAAEVNAITNGGTQGHHLHTHGVR